MDSRYDFALKSIKRRIILDNSLCYWKNYKNLHIYEDDSLSYYLCDKIPGVCACCSNKYKKCENLKKELLMYINQIYGLENNYIKLESSRKKWNAGYIFVGKDLTWYQKMKIYMFLYLVG